MFTINNNNTSKRKLEHLKSRLISFENYLNTFINISEEGTLDKQRSIELENRYSENNKLFKEYEDTHLTIEFSTDEIDDANDAMDAFEQFESDYHRVKALAQATLAKFKPSQSDTSETRSINLLQPAATPNLNAKLPVISIPKFDGNYDKWLEFKNTYESLIHLNTDVTPTLKFHYLRASLSGPPLDTIQSIDFTPQNYNTAWKILTERYDNTKLLVHNHIKALLKIEIFNYESSVKLRKMIDDIAKHVRILKTLKEPTEHWNSILIFIFLEKLPTVTRREWEMGLRNIELSPTLNDFLDFLKKRADLFETIEHKEKSAKPLGPKQPETRVAKAFVTSSANCSYCNKEHSINSCQEFLKINTQSRFDFVKSKGLCMNCLRKGHLIADCNSGHCRKCNGKHNTLLHFERNNRIGANVNNFVEKLAVTEVQAVADATDTSKSNCATCTSQPREVLLSTAIVQVLDKNNKIQHLRALLDTGSQLSFMTENAHRKLDLPKGKVNIAIVGINQIESNIEYKCETTIEPTRGHPKISMSFLIIPRITGNTPNFKVNIETLNIPSNIKLADPNFHLPGPIDILIGSEHIWNLLCVGNLSLGKHLPTLQKTIFGWIIAGPVAQPTRQTTQSFKIEAQLKKFWELEECDAENPRMTEENLCELHFLENAYQEEDGRFYVAIPFKQVPDTLLGDSRAQAQSRFLTLEKKLKSNETLKAEYTNFMREYLHLGHMSKVEQPNSIAYYMPHHAVYKESSTTTKLRVVFDGSAKSSSGYSINDLQYVGPTIQEDLLSILLRFRQHNFVLTADIAKMYRQVFVRTENRKYQQIIWRENPDEPMNTYQLNTVTYGTACAAFLAIRCIFQVADNYAKIYPEAANIIKRDFYVDDVLTGTSTKEEAIRLKSQLTEILASGRFELRKWASNNPEILDEIDFKGSIELSSTNNKTLGIVWNPHSDTLSYDIMTYQDSERPTKRLILSRMAQIFDPLGLLSPVIITFKIIMQDLWKHKLSWDESLPIEIHTKWVKLMKEISNLSQLQVPRQVTLQDSRYMEMHGFSDASNSAYGACLYIRSIDSNGIVRIRLLTAKSKVAPVKKITTPKLELCGAVLLSKVLEKAKNSWDLHPQKIILWTDSTTVLSWIKTPSNHLKIFVSNRIAIIQQLTETCLWRYVPTQDNPADYITRGVIPSKLPNLEKWWKGPSWLLQDETQWPNQSPKVEVELSELKLTSNVLIVQERLTFPIARFSNLNRLKRIMGYCLRIAKKAPRNKTLTTMELRHAMTKLILVAQEELFSEQINCLRRRQPLKKNDKLTSLNPFLDECGILRVGGRLQNSLFNYGKKHPAILHARHHLTKLIFEFEHRILLHAGPKALLCSIRERYWPIAGQNLSKAVVRNCATCIRYNTQPNIPIMGNLPAPRVRETFPFENTGVDYAGPFIISDRKGRGSKTSKCYVCIFICFACKAIHLELVSGLSKEAFIATFRRFVSRRGRPANVYSDNGTNFVGANNELKQLGQFLSEENEDLKEHFANDGVQWHFIPPRAPNFGGLWEAGVKSIKFHLKRVMGDAALVFENLNTLLNQIEAVLNSRPLAPLSNLPDELFPLTPAHFLIGRSFSDLPDPSVEQIPINRLSMYQRLQQLRQHFWRRWSKEYVSELQQRCKWKQNCTNLGPNTLVLIKEENLPPGKWLLGRVTEVHPGKDGIVRVATITTSKGTLRRAISRLCPLTTENP